VGDRNWAVMDGVGGRIRTAKRWPQLLSLTARYLRPPPANAYGDAVAPVELSAPDGATCRSDDPACADWLSAQLGRPARLAARRPAWDRDHYRLDRPRSGSDIAAELDLQQGESLPDFGTDEDGLLAQLQDHATPPGSYVDAYPIHLVTSNALQALAEASGFDASARRFRPNLVVDMPGGPGMPERDWIGRRLRIGSLVLAFRSPTLRCGMPARPQPLLGLAAQPGLTRALVEHCGRTLGLNAVVEHPGRVALGDTAELI
jgi:uncharacterized protein YcbX